MRVTGSERRPHTSDAAVFLLVLLLLPLPLPLPSAARALSPSTPTSTTHALPSQYSHPTTTPSPAQQRQQQTTATHRKNEGGKSSTSPTPPPQKTLSPRVVQTQQGPLRGILLDLKGLVNMAQPNSPLGREAGSTRSQGQQGSTFSQLEAVESFWGVRYASPPVGRLRFAPPEPPEKWEEVRVADSFAPVCPQKFPVDFNNRTASLAVMPKGRYLRIRRILPLLANQSEDCLFLNIYVPGGVVAAKRDSSLAVIFYIHGESYEWNSGNHYDGSVLAALGNVIVVTMNFRLGAFGFMQTGPARTDASSDPTTVDGNWGLLDVLEALRWIRKNVEAFGGDKNRVTLAGHHTGAALVHLLLVSTAARGLFQRSVMLSGSAQSLWALVREPRALRRKVAEKLGCLHPAHPISEADLLISNSSQADPLPAAPPPAPEGEDVDITPCLRRATTAQLLASYPQPLRFLARFGPSLREDDIGPWLDGSYEGIPSSSQSSGGGLFARTPLLLGAATAEAYSELSAEDVRWGLEEDRRDALLRTFVANSFYFHRREILSAVKNEYSEWVGVGADPRARTARSAEAKFGDGPPTFAPTINAYSALAAKPPTRYQQHPITVRDATVEALGDGQTVAPLVSVARAHAGAKSAPTYFLHFSHHAKDGIDYAQDRLGSSPEEIVSNLFGAAVLGGVSPVLFAYTTVPSELPLNYTRQDVSVATATIKYLTNFAKSGDPNVQMKREGTRSQALPSGRTEQSGRLPLWLPFDLTSQMHLNMGPKPKMRSHYRSHKMALWLNLIPLLHRSQDEEDTSPHHEFLEKESHFYAGATFNKSVVHPYWRLGAVWSKGVMHTALPPPLNCESNSSQGGSSISSSSFSNPSLPPKLSTVPRNTTVDASGGGSDTGIGGAEDDNSSFIGPVTITVTLGILLLILNAAVLVAGFRHHQRVADSKGRAKKKKKKCKGAEEVLSYCGSDRSRDGQRRFGELLDGLSDSKSDKDFVEVGTELGIVGILPVTYPDVMSHDHQVTFKGDIEMLSVVGCETVATVKKQVPLDLPASNLSEGDKDAAQVDISYIPDTSSLSRKRQGTGKGTLTKTKTPQQSPSPGVSHSKKDAPNQEISV